MSTSAGPPPERPGTFLVGGTMVVPSQPDEPVFPLKREQFDLLCEGESVAHERTFRDTCLGIGASAAIGAIGLLASIDWDATFKDARKGSFIWVCSMSALAVAAITVATVLHFRLVRATKATGYSRVKSRIETFFEHA